MTAKGSWSNILCFTGVAVTVIFCRFWIPTCLLNTRFQNEVCNENGEGENTERDTNNQ